MDYINLPHISVIIIGLNEASHLENCILSILNSNYPKNKIELIYVDSGSTDSSVEIAKKYTNKIFVEPIWPTAARNRNRGLIQSSNDYLHFTDGDIIIDPDYLRFAINKLSEGTVQCVFGMLKDIGVTRIGKILLHDYNNRKPGLIDSPGAGGTFLKSILLDVNGWDERIPRGEESELGERLRRKGYKIWFLDKPMGFHDYGITSIGQLFRRQVNDGISAGAILKINSTDRFFRTTKKVAIKNILFHVILFLVISTSFYLQSLFPFILFFFIYSIFLFFKYRIIRKIRKSDSLKFYFIMNFTKTFVLYGFFKFQFRYMFSNVNKRNLFKERMIISS